MGWQCERCGFRVTGGVTSDILDRHVCHPHGIARVEAARFEQEFSEFLGSPSGMFHVHVARLRLERGELGEAA